VIGVSFEHADSHRIHRQTHLNFRFWRTPMARSRIPMVFRRAEGKNVGTPRQFSSLALDGRLRM